MNSQAQPPRDKGGKGRRWPRITLGMVVVGLVAFIAWNGIQLAGVFGDMGAIGDFFLPDDEGQVVVSPIATTTQPPSRTEPAPTTTSTSTTTTTFVVGGLGPPCVPSACDPDVVAKVDRADYIHNGIRGVLGWLMDWTQPSITFDDGFTFPPSEGSLIAGVLVDIELRSVEASVLVWEIPPVEYDVLVATFYFGDDPTTSEPITGGIMLGLPDEEYSIASTGSTCNIVGQSEVGEGFCGGAGSYGTATMEEWLAVLTIGRAYHLDLVTSRDRESVETLYRELVEARDLPPVDAEVCESQGCVFDWVTFDHWEYAERLVSLVKGGPADPPLAPDGFAQASMFMFPPLVDVAGPAVVVAVEPDCDECSSVVTLFESASPRMPILVLELDEAGSQRLDIDTFPAVLIVDENGVMKGTPFVGEFTPERADSLINTACVLLGGCGPVEG